jgi:hypothetical protein
MGLEENEEACIIIGGHTSGTSLIFYQKVAFFFWKNTVLESPGDGLSQSLGRYWNSFVGPYDKYQWSCKRKYGINPCLEDV